MKTQNLFNSSGFTLTEVLVATVSISILMLALAASINTTSISLQALKRSLTPDQIQQNLMRMINTPRALAFTCLNNPTFRQCFVTGAASCFGNQLYPMNLYDSSGRAIAGTPAAPIFYNRDNSICTAGQAACDFRVVAQFRPQGFPQDCGSGCQALLPRDFPPNGMLHELMVVSFTITANGALAQQLPELASRSGSVTFALNAKYKDTGCPMVTP